MISEFLGMLPRCNTTMSTNQDGLTATKATWRAPQPGVELLGAGPTIIIVGAKFAWMHPDCIMSRTRVPSPLIPTHTSPVSPISHTAPWALKYYIRFQPGMELFHNHSDCQSPALCKGASPYYHSLILLAAYQKYILWLSSEDVAPNTTCFIDIKEVLSSAGECISGGNFWTFIIEWLIVH